MRIKQKILGKIEKTSTGKRLVNEQRYRVVFFAAVSFALNLLYAFYNGVLGIAGGSMWFGAMCAYYVILSTLRFSAVFCERKGKNKAPLKTEYFVMKFSGILLMLLSIVLSGVIYVSIRQNIAVKHGTIVMITIAAYTFGKITMAIIRAVKERKNPSPLLAAIRSISYAEVAASVLTLQRSMLVSFGEMGEEETLKMNAATGAAVCLFVFLLGGAMLVKGIKKEGIKSYGKI